MTYEQAIDKIKTNAPKGATHFNTLGGYFKKVTGLWYLYSPFTDEWLPMRGEDFEGLEKL